MDKMLDSPWFLRFTALFLAILLFYNVQVEQGKSSIGSANEDVAKIENVPVEVYYDNENLIVTGVPETVNVTIEGPANIVQTTRLLKDFTLFVDLRSLLMGEHEVRIQDENLSEKLRVRIDPSTINVNIEEKITETFRVEPEFNDRLLAEGYYVADMDVKPSTVEVTGAKSVIESISYVKATVSAESGVKASFEQDAKVRVLDRDLNKLDVEMASENVKVKVVIEENKKEIPIVLSQKGAPPTGVKINSITPETDKITLSGPRRILNEIESFPVEIDVSKINKSGTIDVKLQKPNDVFKLSAATLKVKVDVDVEDGAEDEAEVEEAVPEITTIQIEGIPITVTGLDAKFKSAIISPESGSIDLTVKANSDIIGSLKTSDFTASIDASAIEEEGEGTYPLLVKGPSQVEWTLSKEEATITIELA